MFIKIIEHLNKKNALWKVNLIKSFIKDKEKILDFGSGDLSLSMAMKKKFPKLDITGIDVVHFKNPHDNIQFVQYNGKKLPFKDNSFDTVYSFYVFHHCNNPEFAFSECFRVAKKRVVFVESTYRYIWEIIFMKALDIFYNALKFAHISPPHAFYSFDEWISLIKKHGKVKITAKQMKQKFFPSWVPIGTTWIFEVVKN